MNMQDDSSGQDDGKSQSDAPAAAARQEALASDVEQRLRRDMARFREQVKSAQAEKDAAIAAIQAQSDARLIRSELRVAAIRSGIIDVDALRLIGTQGLLVAEDGSIQGADEAVAALKSAKPYLFDETRWSPSAPQTTSHPRRPPIPAQADPIDARTLSREQWQVERAKVLTQSR